MINKRQNDEFLSLLVKLNAAEAYGLAKVMGVSIFAEGDNALKTGETLLFDMVEKFPTLRRTLRRDIIRLLREVEHDGFSTED